MSRTKLSDNILKLLSWGAAIISLGVLVWIIGYVIYNGAPHITLDFIFSEFKGDSHGIFPMIINTLIVVVVSIMIATPIGMMTSVYLCEYSKSGPIVNSIRSSTETLAGIPSIIYGLFGYIFFVGVLNLKMSILSGALTISIMILPMIIRSTEEALKCVPMSYREGSLALGASKLITLVKVVLPSALPGVLASVILSIGRIVGETAAIYLTAGMVPRIPALEPSGLLESGRTLAVHLYILAKEGISLEETFATATVLLVVVALINFASTKAVSKVKKWIIGI